MDEGAGKKTFLKPFVGEGIIAARFRNWSIALFALACLLIASAMSAAFYRVIKQVSADYAGRYAVSSAKALGAHIVKEVSLMSKAARSQAVIDWLADEGDGEKKARAYEELSGILGELYSSNLYVGFVESLNEYQIEKNLTGANITAFDVLEEGNPEDIWYFDCVASDQDYALSIGIDNVLQKKRVWIDYKVERDGVLLGVICTGLEFSQLAEELLAHYDNVMRGLIINSKGVINIDSAHLDPEDYMKEPPGAGLEDEFTDPYFLSEVKTYLGNIRGYFGEEGEPTLIELTPGPYRYVTVAPIMYTDWSAVIFYDSSSSFNMKLFLPAITAALVVLVAFVLAAGAVGNRLVFSPMAQLVLSLSRLKSNKEEPIYGLERMDEFGTLANTINDLFNRTIRDALTNLYNRRYMENTLQSVMDFMSRSNSQLSVFMIDVDFFKKYNDGYGHEQGDKCLKSVAQALVNSVGRVNDFVARYGGEEFIVVLPNTDEAGACVVAQKMLDNVQRLGMPHEGNSAAPCVTVSIGVTTGAVVYTNTWEEFVKKADEALYASKQNGRNRYTYFPFAAS